MNWDEFDALFDQFEESAFRLETLSFYESRSDGLALRAFLRGVPMPTWDRETDDWRRRLRVTTAAGISWKRVHIIPEPLTPYLRYEIEWGYYYNAEAGEQIYMLRDDHPLAAEGFDITDYWLLDDKKLVFNVYDSAGRLIDFRVDPDPGTLERCRDLRDRLLEAATPLMDYLADLRGR